MDQEPTIRVLPQDVVNRIAAGEVVQRPANALKELLENSLDAGAKTCIVAAELSSGSKQKSLDFSISDDGHGISKADLSVAATRFATSKLKSVDDFRSLVSFGFRGEALASISMVSHLTITSRTKGSSVAHECTYIDGKPQIGNPKRCARVPGTSVKVKDLFYNVPHRRKSLKPKDEYQRMLAVMQPYAVQIAKRGVGLVVQQLQAKGKNTKTIVDLNTSTLAKVKGLSRLPQLTENDDKPHRSSVQQQEATKQVIATIYGSYLEQHLLYFQSESVDTTNGETTTFTASPMTYDASSKATMTYSCEGFLTSPSLATTNHSLSLSKATVLLFVNDRHVECPPLKRHLEDAYTSLTQWIKPPFVYLSLHVPATQVDVNVHPTKNQVTLLFLEDIVKDLSAKIHQTLDNQGRIFGADKKSNRAKNRPPIDNPYRKKKTHDSQTSEYQLAEISLGKRKRSSDSENQSDNMNRPKPEGTSESQDQFSSLQPSRNRISGLTPSSVPLKRTQPSQPSKMVRVCAAAPAGAIEPFLVKRDRMSQSSRSSQSSSNASMSQHRLEPAASQTMALSPPAPIEHKPPCPFASAEFSLDMSLPGAFAQLSRQCTCRRARSEEQSTQNIVYQPPKQRFVRPKPVVPTDCQLDSVCSLRRRVRRHLDFDLQQRLRQSHFVGVVSEQRSLVQWKGDLLLLNHYRLAKALFYQLALASFGGNRIATLGAPISILAVIEQALQIEEDIQDEKLGLGALNDDVEDGQENTCELEALWRVNETNALLAKQATSCLWENSEMLEDYFGIRIELHAIKEGGDSGSKRIVLTGLPVLLEGHVAPPHGLPLFLLRLATEVNWSEERPCFEGVCREIASYYAHLPGRNSELRKSHVQHTLFPAISFLLNPSHRLNAHVATLTDLQTLYKVFERC